MNVTDRRQTDGRQHIANVNVSLRSLKGELGDINFAEYRYGQFAAELLLSSYHYHIFVY